MSDVALATSMSRAGLERRARGRLHVQRFPGAGRHAPADQLAPFLHGARNGIALGPAEPLRALRVAGAQLLAGERLALVLVALRVIGEAERDRVDRQFVGELVHRRLDREHAECRPGRAHVGWRVEIGLDELVVERRVFRAVEQSGPVDHVFLVILELRRVADRLVVDRGQCAVRVGAEGDRLDRVRTIAEGEHLLSGQRHAHGAFQFDRGHARRGTPDIAGASPSRTRLRHRAKSPARCRAFSPNTLVR